MKDEIYTAPYVNPTKDFYSIFENAKDGTKAYYRYDMYFYYRYVGVYGHFEGRWSYTNCEADVTYG